MAVDRG